MTLSLIEEHQCFGGVQSIYSHPSSTTDLRVHEKYDHSYYFIASFMNDHLRFHAQALGLV